MSWLAALSLALQAAAPAQTLPPPGEAPAAPAQVAPPVIDAPPPVVDPEQAAFTAFVTGLRPRAIAEGVNPATFDREVMGLMINERVIRSDRAQPGGGATGAPSATINFAPYRIQHVDAARIQGGQRRYASLRPLLGRIEQETGVPEAIMLSLYGHETGYGSFSGRTDLLQSFATLAWEGRRRELFTGEFIATLKLIDKGIPRSTLKGSWAGATGYPQFLPSTYLRIAKDGDGDGKIDIWNNETDALASIANYLVDAGWKPNVAWGVAVQVPGTLDRASLRSTLNSPRCPRVHMRLSRWMSFAEWKAKGITPLAYPGLRDEEQMTLIEPDGPDATAYLLSSNYQVILDYNCSNFYGLAAGLLADEIVR